MAPNILMSRNDGLGARLIPMLSALRLAELTGARLRIFWPAQDSRANVSAFADLFAPDFSDRYFITDAEYRQRRLGIIPASRFCQMTPEEFAAKADPAADYFIDDATGPARLAGEEDEAVRRDYRAAMALINFTPRVRVMMALIDATFEGRQVTAYHIRHGDVTTSYRARGKPWPNKYVPPEIYLEHMRQSGTGPDRPALLISDTPASIDWLAARQPGVTRLGDIVALDGLTSLQFDFLELYAMSRATTILAPEMSGFSRVAAAIGAVPIQDVGEALTPESMSRAMTALQRRLETDPDDFLNDGEIAQATVHLRRWLTAGAGNSDLSGLLDQQLGRGNTVPLIYRFRAEDAYRAGDAKALAETADQAREAMVPLPNLLSEIDTMQAGLAFAQGRAEQGTVLLRRGLFLGLIHAFTSPAVLAWLNSDPRPTTPLYPFEPQMIDLISLSQGQPPRRVDTRGLLWDLRHFLSSSFRGPLTAGGGDGLLRDRIARLERQDGIRGTATERSLKSYRSQVEMEGTDPASALALSREMAEDAPMAENRWAVQRFALNLMQAREYSRARYWFAQLAELWPDEPVYHGCLAAMLLREAETDLALHHFERANPAGSLPYPVFAARHAQLLDRMKREDEADAILDLLLEETGWGESHISGYVRRVLRQARPFKHLVRLTRLADEAGPHRSAQGLVAQLLAQLGQTEDARARAEAALKAGGVPVGDQAGVRAILSGQSNP